MDRSNFISAEMGRFVPFRGIHPITKEEYDTFSFIPAPLPPEITLSIKTVNLIAEASHQLGILQASLKGLPDSSVLLRPALLREAQSTSALEGTYAPIQEVFEGELISEKKQSSQVSEVLNYARAARIAFELINEKPININMLSNLQGMIVEGTEGAKNNQGEIRTIPVIIGDRSQKVSNARFIPCLPGDDLKTGYGEWEKWIHSSNNVPKIAKIALAHYQFETLHPYTDGNGRLGRLIISLQLVMLELLPIPILNLSKWFHQDGARYKDELLALSQLGDFNRWISYFCTGVAEQCKLEIRIIDSLTDFQAKTINKLQEAKERGVVLQLAGDLIRNPVFTASSTAKLFNVTYPPASAAIKKLIALGVIKEQKGDRINSKWYYCPEFFEIISS